jgi:hypothetical protein
VFSMVFSLWASDDASFKTMRYRLYSRNDFQHVNY